ncbi:MAG: hypothetical protein ACI8XV_001872, partial [Arenicella sp.]
QDAFNAYESHLKDEDRAAKFRTHRKSHGIIDIHFVGVWDTVAALGFPKRTDRDGLTLNILSLVFNGLEKISNKLWPHSFYDFELSKNIKHAYQALAIDDERTAFWPLVWDEVKAGRTVDDVEQVWFSGMHSNVGGGYERQGMANVTLNWMMLRAKKHGLVFKPGIEEMSYQDSNMHGRIYNSRDGLAVFYRYHPREIKTLCKNKLLNDIKVHNSVLERLRMPTANYIPMVLPAKFDVVESIPGTEVKHLDVSDVLKNTEVAKQQTVIDSSIKTRKKLYGWLANLAAFLLAYIIYYSVNNTADNMSLVDLVFEAIEEKNIQALAINLYEYHLHAIAGFLVISLYLVNQRRLTTDKMTIAAEKLRKLVVNAS